MTSFPVHTHETAPEGSKEILTNVEKSYGFLPNLMATFAESPAAIEAYAAISGIFEKSDFTATEKQIILMTNNRLNGCTYCMAAHTTISQMQGVPQDVIEALRDGSPVEDPKLEALLTFAAQVNEQRGVLDPADIDAFLAAGYTKANVLEVIVGTAMKVMSNYTNHVADTPVDGAFQANAWTPDQSVAA
ncbi:carboxymuconolactone decarboxylase family protein [Parasphingorhabdus sp.]|uniref:carboxymuconolactone decarboxylase family protein n=1 Tax=Parasphingorhabdus sp. TaxID=2709688 RepID=UPI003264E023